jgi:hypothetical protein
LKISQNELARCSSAQRIDGVNEMALLYQIQVVPGKGQSLVAQKDIRTGTHIQSEAPLFTAAGISSADQMESSIANKLQCLSVQVSLLVR